VQIDEEARELATKAKALKAGQDILDEDRLNIQGSKDQIAQGKSLLVARCIIMKSVRQTVSNCLN
jgi:hypothetical protein